MVAEHMPSDPLRVQPAAEFATALPREALRLERQQVNRVAAPRKPFEIRYHLRFDEGIGKPQVRHVECPQPWLNDHHRPATE